jgi:hypothetical protein
MNGPLPKNAEFAQETSDELDLKDMSLDVVHFEKDRQQVFEAMVSRPLIISALAKDGEHFLFGIDRVERSTLFLKLKPGAGRRPRPFEPLTLTFGLDAGQYFLNGRIEVDMAPLYTVPIGEQLYRMQRRTHFRVPVPKSLNARFELHGPSTDPDSASLELADISGGGFAVWYQPGENSRVLSRGEQVSGKLLVGKNEPLNINGVVSHTRSMPGDTAVKVGIQCRGLSQAEERQLIAVCLQIHRQLFTVFRRFNR